MYPGCLHIHGERNRRQVFTAREQHKLESLCRRTLLKILNSRNTELIVSPVPQGNIVTCALFVASHSMWRNDVRFLVGQESPVVYTAVYINGLVTSPNSSYEFYMLIKTHSFYYEIDVFCV